MSPSRFPRLALLLALALACGSSLRAEELGNGLTYVRHHDASTSLPKRIDGPTVFDFRYLEPDQPAAALESLLQSPGPLRIVIHGETPPPALADALAHRAPNVLTLAPNNANPEADFELAVEPAEDRAAYDAYEQGTPLPDLIRTGTDKPRRDEAALVRANGHPAPQRSPEEEEIDPKTPIDRLLQRAVQLARGLVALNHAE